MSKGSGSDSFFLPLDTLLSAMISDGLLDTSNYPSDHPLYSAQYTAKIGLFKDEGGGVANYTDWVFLRPKQYSLLSDPDKYSSIKSKGVMLRQAPQIDHSSFVNHQLKRQRGGEETAEEEGARSAKQRRIGSKNHQLYTMYCNKLVFSKQGDDKRYWLPDENTSLAYGHHRIPSSAPALVPVHTSEPEIISID